MKTCLSAPLGSSLSLIANLKGFGHEMSVAIVAIAIILLTEACRPQPVYGEEVLSASASPGYQIEPYPVKSSLEMPSLIPARLIMPASLRVNTEGPAVTVSLSAPHSPKTIAGTSGVGLYYGSVSSTESGVSGGSVFDRWFQSRRHLGLVLTKLSLVTPVTQHGHESRLTGGSVILGISWRPYEREGS